MYMKVKSCIVCLVNLHIKKMHTWRMPGVSWWYPSSRVQFPAPCPASGAMAWCVVSSSVCFDYSGQFTETRDHHRVSNALCCPGFSLHTPKASSPQVSSPLPGPPLTTDKLETLSDRETVCGPTNWLLLSLTVMCFDRMGFRFFYT